MTSTLIVGATRGLGAALVKAYAALPSSTVYGTSRSGEAPKGFPESVKWIVNVDLMKSSVGDTIVDQLPAGRPLSNVVRSLMILASLVQPDDEF